MKSRLRTTTASSRASLESRVLVYSAMAGAACLAAPTAQATPENITFSSAPASGSHFNDGYVNFSPGPFTNMAFYPLNSSGRYQVLIRGGFATDGHVFLAPMLKSQTFQSLRFAISGRFRGLASFSLYKHVASAIGGNFQSPHGTGYIAFKDRANSHEYYGWLKVRVAANGKSAAFVPVAGNIYGAYDLTSAALADNFRVGSLAAVPEPANVATGLGLFALGAAGLREHRRRRKLVA